MELGNKRKFLLRKFFNEYLDLNRSKEDEQLTVDAIRSGVEFKGTNLWVDFCYLYRFIGTECQFYGGNHRCHVDFSFDGTYHGSGPFYRTERFRADETLTEKLPGSHAVQCDDRHNLFFFYSAG